MSWDADKEKAYKKEYNAKNKEKIKEYQKQYREKNADKSKKYNKEYRAKNKDKLRAKCKQYRQDRIQCEEKRVAYNEQCKQYYKEYKDKEWYQKYKQRRKEKSSDRNRQTRLKHSLLKEKAVAHLGGCCKLCGLVDDAIIYDFHHRDPSTKKFKIGERIASMLWDKVVLELDKCDLLCCICHTKHHAVLKIKNTDCHYRTVYHRNRIKERYKQAMQYLGGCCKSCGVIGDPIIYDFHHRNVSIKENGINKIIGHRWEKLVIELDKCDLLCRICHRKFHYGLLELADNTYIKNKKSAA